MVYLWVREKVRSAGRSGIFIKLSLLSLLVGAAVLVYYDYGVYTSRRSSSSQDERAAGSQQKLVKQLPKAIAIGFPICGAGAVPEHMSMHPDVAYSKDVNFFTDEEKYKKGMGFYKDAMPESALDSMGIERALHYVYHAKAAERIYQLDSKMKFIVGLCDPVRRLLNQYIVKAGEKLTNNETYPDLEDIILKKDGSLNEDNDWVMEGRYALYLEPWLKQFPRKNFYFMNGDHLRKEPMNELERFEHWLGLDKFLTAVKLEDYRVKRAKLYTDQKRVRPHRPDLDKKIEDMLKAYYAPYDQQLATLTGASFTWI